MEDKMEMDQAPVTSSTSAVPRACDACRARKIRCNRETPCAHCVQAKIECSTNLEARAREKRARILLTPQYERKIDQLDRRLDGIVRLLEDIKTQLVPSQRLPNNDPTPGSTVLSVPRLTSPAPSPASHSNHADTTSVVEGNSSLAAHSTFANDLLRKVVDRDTSLKMDDTLDTLRHLVNAMRQQPAAQETTYPRAKAVPLASTVLLKQCELPPIQKTVQILKLAKSEKATPLAWVYEVFPVHMFPETCMRVYFSDDYTIAEFIIVNCGLHALYWTYVYLCSPPDADEYRHFSDLCAKNMEVALSSLPLHVPATVDYVMALLAGAFYATEISKPSLAWILNTKAAELCQTLGYHRSETYKNDRAEDARHRQFLFWAVYILDKGLSLRLGRPSALQDYDITVPYPASDDPYRSAICAFTTLWTKTAQAQGLAYERLYSSEALSQPEHVRRSRVEELARNSEALEVLAAETIKKHDDWCNNVAGPEVTVFLHKADHVLRLSLLTTIYRAVPNAAGSATTFSPECIQAARATLDVHQECMAVNEKGNLGLLSSYMNWTILFSPFVPFLVLFCQVIETKDRDDLSRLHAFISSISVSSAAPENEGTTKLRKLFEVLCNIASRYVGDAAARRDTLVDGNDPSADMNDGIGAYLATLGFPSQDTHDHTFAEINSPADPHQAADSYRSVNPMLWMGNGTQLEDWFYSNQQMMEFLDDGHPAGIS